MSISDAVIGRGDLIVSTESTTFQFRFDIRQSGIRCYSKPTGDFTSLFDILKKASASAIRPGSHLVLTGLPASPADAFRNLTLAYTPDVFTLTVANAAPFSPRLNYSLKDLHLDFTFHQGARRVQVAGGVTLVLFNRDIPLRAILTDSSGLVFRPDPGTAPLTVASIGSMPLGGLELGAQYERWANLQALYAFGEINDSRSKDTSGVFRADAPDPLDLKLDPRGEGIAFPPDIAFGQDGLSGLPDAAPDPSPAKRSKDISSKPATKITHACRETSEITVAAWLKPARTVQSGPAVIASIGKDNQTRFCTVGQGARNGQPASYSVRLRTSETGLDGAPLEVVLDPTGATLTYLVYTRDASGNCALFLNGARRSSGTITGDLDWNDDFGLVLLNEFTGDRPWAGTLRRLEFYSRAVTDDEVRLNYNPATIVRASGSLSAAGAFNFTPQAQPKFPRLTGSIDLREETLAAQGKGPVALLITGRLDLFPASSPVQVGAEASATIDTAGVVQCRAAATVQFDDFVMADPFLQVATTGVTLEGTWLGGAVVFKGRDDTAGFILGTNVAFDVPFTPTVGPMVDPATGAIISGEVTLHHLHAAVQADLSTSGFTARVNVSVQWTDDTGVVHNAQAKEFNLFSPPPTRNELFEAVVAEVKAQAVAILSASIVHGEDYYFLQPSAPPATTGPDATRGIVFLGSSAAALKTHIVSTLPTLYATAPATPAASEKGIFTLSQGASGCTLTIELGTHSSAEIEGDYRDFLTHLEAPVLGASLLPGAAQMVKARIAERLPMTLDQVLYFHYGFKHIDGSPPQNFVDLQAGMRLRVDYQNYQLTHPSDASAPDGFVGSGTCYYQLSGYAQPTLTGGPLRLLGFDAFLVNIQSTVTTDVAAIGAGGILEIQREGLRRPYFRLFYPPSFAGPGAQGFAGIERLATIVGAQTLTELETSTKAYLAGKGGDDAALPGSFFFRGRAAVIPEICVFVQESPHYVPVGATVRQILERFGGIPTAGRGDDLSAFRGRLRPRRLAHEGVNSAPTYKFIDLTTYRFFAGSSLDLFDLPVVKGDRFYF